MTSPCARLFVGRGGELFDVVGSRPRGLAPCDVVGPETGRTGTAGAPGSKVSFQEPLSDLCLIALLAPEIK